MILEFSLNEAFFADPKCRKLRLSFFGLKVLEARRELTQHLHRYVE